MTISSANTNNASGEQMRILAGIFDEMTRRIFDRHNHTRTGACAGADCPKCMELIEREAKARAIYQAELDSVFG